jgi:uncharacterized protein (TIGR03000 family)
MKLQFHAFLRIPKVVCTAVLLVASAGWANSAQAAEGHGGGVHPAVAAGRGYYGGRYGYGYGGYGWRGYGYGWGVGVGWGCWGYLYPYYADYPYPYYPYGYPAQPAGVAPPSSGVTAMPNPAGDVALSVLVPPDAQVWVNGEKMTQSGPRRDFVASGLLPGRSYTFEVRTEWNGQDGKPIDLVQRIPMQAGDRRAISITAPQHEVVVPTALGAVR